jgi:hypothetical protein
MLFDQLELEDELAAVASIAADIRSRENGAKCFSFFFLHNIFRPEKSCELGTRRIGD